MSIAVPLPELPDQVGRFGPRGFLVTVSDDGRAHPASVVVTVGDDGTLRMGAGRRTSANVTARPTVTLLWAGPLDGLALLVDGTGTVDGDAVVVTPTWAVLHQVAGA